MRSLDKSGVVKPHTAKAAGPHLTVHSAGNALTQGIGLFVDFFVHVMGCITEFCFTPVVLEHRNVRFNRLSFGGGDGERPPADDRQITIFEIDHTLCVSRQWMRVA